MADTTCEGCGRRLWPNEVGRIENEKVYCPDCYLDLMRVKTGGHKNDEKLIKCPDCDASISKRAASCPHCGAPIRCSPSPESSNLRAIANYQKNLIVSFLAALIIPMILFLFAVLTGQFGWLVLALLIYLALGVVVLVFTLLLSFKVYHPAIAVVLAGLSFIPLINLIVLVIVNGRAARLLRGRGIKVGLMGAIDIPES